MHSDNAGAEIRLLTGPGNMRNGDLSYAQCKEFIARVEQHLARDEARLDPNPLSSGGGGRSTAEGLSQSATGKGSRSSSEQGEHWEHMPDRVVACPNHRYHAPHHYTAIAFGRDIVLDCPGR